MICPLPSQLRPCVFSQSWLCRFCRVLRASVRVCPLNFSLFLYCPIFVLLYLSLPLSFSFSLPLPISLPFSRGFSPRWLIVFLFLSHSQPSTTNLHCYYLRAKGARSFSFSRPSAFSHYSHSGARCDESAVCSTSGHPNAGKCPEAARTTVANNNGATLTCPSRRRLASSVAVTSARKANQARHFNSASSAAATRTTRQGCRSDSPSTNSAYHFGQVVHSLTFFPPSGNAHTRRAPRRAA